MRDLFCGHQTVQTSCPQNINEPREEKEGSNLYPRSCQGREGGRVGKGWEGVEWLGGVGEGGTGTVGEGYKFEWGYKQMTRQRYYYTKILLQIDRPPTY